MSDLVRARHNETGHIAALPKDALALGMCPGWAEAAGPAPAGPKTAAFPPKETEDAGEQTPPETADTTSAKKTRS
jgi:hypothetical protein